MNQDQTSRRQFLKIGGATLAGDTAPLLLQAVRVRRRMPPCAARCENTRTSPKGTRVAPIACNSCPARPHTRPRRLQDNAGVILKYRLKATAWPGSRNLNK